MSEANYFSQVPDNYDGYCALGVRDNKFYLDDDNYEGNLHPVKVVVNSGGTITIVDSEGTRILQGSPTDRGVTIYKQYYSEIDGCVYESCEKFHKGQTLVYPLRKIGELDAEGVVRPLAGIPPECVASDTIWRD